MRYTIVAIFAVATITASPLANASGWEVENIIDEMTGENKAYAYSPEVSSTKPMSFPYNNIKSSVIFRCDSKSETAVVWFSAAPNIIGDKIQSGYSDYKTRVKWDDEIVETGFSQNHGGRGLFFDDESEAINRYLAHSSVLLELDWYSSGRVYFRYDLTGSTAAIEKARAICRGQ